MNAIHPAYELHFQSLFHEGRGLAFPCDAAGSVDLRALPDRARRNYDCARTLIGRDYAAPSCPPSPPWRIEPWRTALSPAVEAEARGP